MDQSAAVEEAGNLRSSSLEVSKSVSDKHLDLLRPSARYYSLFKVSMCGRLPIEHYLRIMTFAYLFNQLRGKAVMVGQTLDAAEKGKYTLIKDVEDFQTGIFDKPLPFFGCGIGWFSFLLGFVCPLMWYYATFHYFGNHYRKDPRERAGLAASAIAAMSCTVVLLIIIVIILFST